MATKTQVLIAHTGQRLQVDISQLSCLDDFKAWVARESSIPVQNIVALTPQGKTFKFQAGQSENEIYIYDIRITQASLSGSANSLASDAPQPKRYSVSAAPNSIDDTRSLQSWHGLFKSRRNWALEIFDDCVAMSDTIQARHDEMQVMAKCLDAAVANLDAAVQPVEPKYKELKKWVNPTQEDYKRLAGKWEDYLDLARSIEISPAMVRFMTGREVRKSRQATLEDLIDLETARKAGKLANTSLKKFNTKVSELDKVAMSMFSGCDDLFQAFDKLMARSILQHGKDSEQLLEDIQAVTKKIDTDYQTTLAYSDSAKEVTQASKTAANHTERLLPSLRTRAQDMDDMLHLTTQARNELTSESLTLMRSIAEITSLHHNVKTQMSVLNQGEEEMTTFDYLRLIQQLPFMYASFVAESVRRREWADKVKADSSTLANEMALFQEEESKRRKKWHKMVGSSYGPEKADHNVMGLEVNLMGEEDSWPALTKKDLDEFLSVVQKQKADEAVIEDITKLMAELVNPTKQQAKRVKAFKNGSVHEAVLGRSGLLIRGDDELLRTLQDEKGKLEGKLKTAESRVRRLEGLLHRQSTESRPSIGNMFQAGSHDRAESISSIKSPKPSEGRRVSSASENNEVLLQRIAQLEVDLNAEKERSAVFERVEKEATARTRNIEGQMDDAVSTKKDLLENMEALKREFMEERKSLEDEVKALKARLEETEDEIEHFGESRENEKVSYDEKLHSLEDEVDRLSKEKQDGLLKTQGQVDFLRNESRLQRERNESLERQLQEARETIKSLTKRAEHSEESADNQLRTLKELHGQMSPKERIPEDTSDLLYAVTNKASGALTKVQSLEQDLSIAKSDLELAHDAVKESKAELATTKETLAAEEAARMKAAEALDREKARSATLEEEASDGRNQLNELRLKMTEGENGSETLRKRLGDDEKRIASLSEQLSSRQSQVGSLEEEVHMYKEKLESADARLGSLNERFEGRDERTKDITQRLFTNNERLCRLLERLGFSVTRQDGKTTIQKIPRSERSARDPNDSSDPSSSIRKSVSLTAASLADSTDLKLLYWMNADDTSSEAAQYQSFISGPGLFDIDAFAEAIYRRVREAEHTARKQTRDARSYRDRAHAAAKEAQEKIAFRHFKEGDLALFLPTRNQTTGAWAAFNVGCPHYFLREQDGHRLRQREWLVARITRVQERQVDLSKSLASSTAAQPPPSDADGDSINTAATGEDDNPFDLSDGLRWWLIDAVEDKAGAPATPGLGKSTVAANNVEAMADMRSPQQTRSSSSKLLGGGSGGKNPMGIEGVSRTLSKSLESRRSSTGSRKALPFAGGAGLSAAKGSALAVGSETNSLRAVAADSPDAGPSAVGSPAKGAATATAEVDGGDDDAPIAPAAAPGEEASEDQQRLMPPPPKPQLQVRTHSHDNEHQLYPGKIRSPQKLQQQQQQHPTQQLQLQRDASNVSVESRDKSVVWDSLWSLDVSYPGK